MFPNQFDCSVELNYHGSLCPGSSNRGGLIVPDGPLRLGVDPVGTQMRPGSDTCLTTGYFGHIGAMNCSGHSHLFGRS